MPGGDRITTEVHATHALTAGMWDEIWQLTAEYYDVQREYAESELRRRAQLAMFRMNGALLGMASIDVYATEFRGRRLGIISTSHVLLRENWRGRNLIQRLGLRTFLRARLRFPFRPIYWFFDSFSYKSYLLLPRNFVEYWPRHESATPAVEAALIDELAQRSYGPAWRPARGVVVRSGHKRLRESAAPVAPGAESDPDIRFFIGANPGHAQGDMLVCLCPLNLRNWLSVGKKAWRRTRRNAPD